MEFKHLVRGWLLFGFFLPGMARADSLDAGWPVVVADELALPRSDELLKVLVPLAETAGIYGTDALRVTAPGGAEVPVQWRVMARWKGPPASVGQPIRFALAQFVVDLAPGEARTYRIARRHAGEGSPAQPANPLRVELDGNFISVITGPLRFDFAAVANRLFQGVFLDADGDGEFEGSASEMICRPWDSIGPVLVDRFGGAYLAAKQANPVFKVEEYGPLALVLRIDGRHDPIPGKAIGRDFLRYSTRYTFVAGSPRVRVEHLLKNDYLNDPLGSIGFGRYLLHAQLAAAGPVHAVFGGDANGAPELHATPAFGQEAVLYQDSAGGGNWADPGTSFSGWRMWSATAGALAPESIPPVPISNAGQRAQGFLDVADPSKGFLVALRYPWQNYPYAMRALGNGSVILDLFPAEFAGLHWLDDAQVKSFEFCFEFHSGPAGTSLETRARAMANPLLAVLPLPYWRETRAWGDVGDLRDPHLSSAVMKADAANDLQTELNAIEGVGGFGAFDFGEPTWAKNTHTTGSPRNRLTYFDKFITSGARDYFVRNEIFALHSMDVRPYHIDGFSALAHPGCNLAEGVPAWPTSDWLGRDQLDPLLAPHRADIPANGHGWNGFDAEHMSVDDVYEYYLLTGSFRAYHALVSIGQGILSWKIFGPSTEVGSSRVIGWNLRALAKIWNVTGEPALLQRAKELVASVEQFRGKLPSPQTSLIYHYLSRAQYALELHNMTQEYDLPWHMAVGLYGLACHRSTTGDMTGDAAIREVASYIAQYCVRNGVVVDALACDDHDDFNPKDDNQGVNTWIPSALAIAWRMSGDPAVKALAELMFDQNDTNFVTADDYYHWYHGAGEVLGK